MAVPSPIGGTGMRGVGRLCSTRRTGSRRTCCGTCAPTLPPRAPSLCHSWRVVLLASRLARRRESLHPVDKVTGRSRGYFVVSKGVAAAPSISLLRLRLDQLRWAPLVSELCAKTVAAKSATELVRIVLQTLRDNGGIPVEFRHVRAGAACL